MKKKRNLVLNFIKQTATPFITVSLIVTISLLIFKKVTVATNGNSKTVVIVMFLTTFLLALAFVVGDRIQRKITAENPANEILEATEKIASGDFSVRLTSTRSYDKYNNFDQIKQNLNLMACELEKNNMLKNDFISNLSHEIKTPLAIIQNYANLLKKDLDEQTKQKCVQTIVTATQKLTDLVSNILKLNKLDNQQLKLEYSDINLCEMLANTLVNFEDLIESKGLNLDCDLSEAYVTSCEGMLEMVWNNLISNAIKFTEPGGSIKVKLTSTSLGATVQISDTGCGISKQTGERIFDKFYQGDTSHAQEGNGLGLALVKKVIDLIGGTITVSSELGKGSTFTVTIISQKN